MLVNKAQLSEIVGKSQQTLTTWQKNGLPIAVDGNKGTANQYDTEQVIDWMVQRGIDRAIGDRSDDDGEYHDPDKELAKLRKHQARKAKVDADLAEGIVLDAEEVQLAMGKMDAEVRTAMLALPSRMAPKVISMTSVRDIRMALKDDVQIALGALNVKQ